MHRSVFERDGDLVHPQYPAIRVMVNMYLTKVKRHVLWGV